MASPEKYKIMVDAKGMTILSIEIMNNRKIQVFRKSLNGENLEVAGDAGTGKTTAVSCLWDLLEKRGDTITHGKTKGHIKIKVGNQGQWILATRINTPKTSRITILDSNGDKVSTATFKQMLSELSINPHKIIDMKPGDQLATLLKSAELSVDLTALDREIAELEDERLDAYRKAELLKPGEPLDIVEPVSIMDLVDAKDKAMEANRLNQRYRNELESIKKEKSSLEEKAAEILAKIEDLKTQLATVQKTAEIISARITKGEPYVEGLVDVDVRPITEQIGAAEETNRKATAYTSWRANSQKHEEAVQAHAKLDQRVKEKRETRKAALDNARWPLEGLTILDGQIQYNGSLLCNLGGSEQKLVCAALALKDILSHPMRVVRMDGVESMSAADYAKLKGLFNGHGIQVLSTRVSRGEIEPNEILIVEGKYEDQPSEGE